MSTSDPNAAPPASPTRPATPRRLGRGLKSLIPTSPTTEAPPANTATANRPVEPRRGPVEIESSVPAAAGGLRGGPVTEAGGSEVRQIRLSAVDQNPRQPRKQFSDAAIESLAESIRLHGVLQPIVVRPRGDRFELIAGERRWRASERAGQVTIPAIVTTAGDQTSAEWALVENLQREDLNPMERADGLDRLIKEFGLTHQEAGSRVGLDRATVSNLLRLRDLDDTSAQLVAGGQLTQGHAKVLLAVADPAIRAGVAMQCVDRAWSVRRLEMEVRQLVAPPVAPVAGTAAGAPALPLKASSQVRELERHLSEHLGTRVQILVGRRKGTGRLIVDFHSLDQFDGLLDRLGYSEQA